MPAPATLPDLVVLIRRSGIVDENRLTRFLAERSRSLSPGELLTDLVAAGLLTPFQAEQLSQGRWKGFTVGEYRLLDLIGRGGMSHVYLAEHATRKTRVAIKVLAARLADDPVAKERFLREARAAVALTHPNIVHVLDVDPDAPSPYLVMEYIDGLSLQAAVARHGTFSAGTAAYCGRQVALGLQRAHEVGLVHRDVKPANLLINRKGLVKILDLGIVRVSADQPEQGSLTRRMGERLILGTAEYMAPEQALDCSAVDSRADLYALGGTLYFLLAGHPPFPDGTPLEKMNRKMVVDPPSIKRLRPDIPRELAAIIHRLLARDPQARFNSPLEVALALSPFARPDPTFPTQLFAPGRPTLAEEWGMQTTPGQHSERSADRKGVPNSPSPPTVVLEIPAGTVPDIDLSSVNLPPSPSSSNLEQATTPVSVVAETPESDRPARRYWAWILVALLAAAGVAIPTVASYLQ